MLFLFRFGLGLDASGAGFYALVSEDCVLQIRQQAHNGRAHAVGSFNCAAVDLAANGACSGHVSNVKLKNQNEKLLPKFIIV